MASSSRNSLQGEAKVRHGIWITELNDDIGIRLYKLYLEQKLVDYTIDCGSQQFVVHSLVIAAASKYFQELIRKNKPAMKCKVMTVNPDIMEVMITYMYLGKAVIKMEYIEAVKVAAKFFKIHGFPEIEIASITEENCVDVNTKDDFDNILKEEEKAAQHSNQFRKVNSELLNALKRNAEHLSDSSEGSDTDSTSECDSC